jgi:hypothetical protein
MTNHKYMLWMEDHFAYGRTADEFRALLTKEQRKSWKACGQYKLPSGKVNEVYSNRSAYICWLRKRASYHHLPVYLKQKISKEYNDR